MPSRQTQKKSSDTKAQNPTSRKTIKKTNTAATVATVATAQIVQADGNQEEEVGKRYFKCIMIDSNGNAICSGRYSGKKPKQAASKACTRLYKETGNEFPKNIVFGMHECTRTSKKKKKYFYVGTRVKLSKPEKVSINKKDPKTGNNMVITYNFNNQVRKLSKPAESDEYNLLFNYDVVETSPQKGESAAQVAKQEPVAQITLPQKGATKKTTAKPVAKTTAKTVAKTTAKTVAKTAAKPLAKKTTEPKKKNLKVVSKAKKAKTPANKTQ